MNILELSEQEIVRRQSLQTLREMGIDPYPAAEFPTNAFSTDIKAEFKDEDEPRQVVIAGRMMGRRVMGKASFAELQDSKGRIQVYIARDEICPDENKDLYNTVFKKLLDIGDFIGVKGFVFRTQTGEISVHAKELCLLSKSLKPLPIVKYKDGVAYDKFDDPELRYRQRYVDLIVNDGVKDTFLQRATVLRTLRSVLDNAGYTEVETPTLQSIAGGASARPFITHFNALDQDMYMRIATELYLKRLIVGGFEGVYEIGKNFRNEGMDRNHNPEFTCMELYVQYKDYNWMMAFTEKLLETICIAVNGKPEREIIYGQRRKVLDGEDISTEMHNMLRENIDSSCKQFLAGDVKDEWDFGALRRHYQGWLTTDADFHYTVADYDSLSQKGIADLLYDRGMQILQAKEVRYGAPVMRELERICLLKCVDRMWMDHIDNMDQLRQGISLRGYGQKDPVVEYRIEGFDMFDQMVDSIRESSIKMLLTIEVRQAGAAPKREQVAKPTGEGFVPGNGAPGVKGAPKGQPVRVIKIGRNDPCPCGSGLKWKKCTCAQYHPEGSNGGEN